MTDLEIIRKCAEKMGGEVEECALHGRGQKSFIRLDNVIYNPLTDDAQCMALGKAFPAKFEEAVVEWASMIRCGERPGFNKVLCEYIARMP